MLRLLVPLLLAATCFALYSGGRDHAFHLDSGHSVRDNPHLRDLGEVPSYFTDARTFSTLRTNLDYRPVLQTSYALNHRIGGSGMRGFHFTQILLHLACALGLFALTIRVLAQARPDLPGPWRDGTAAVAALLFAVHPTASGVVNYLAARSSLLTAAFLLPAFWLYMVPADHPRHARARWGTALLYGLALFTKVEAVAGVAVLFLYDAWQASGRDGERAGFLASLGRALSATTLRRLAPSLAVLGLYLVLRRHAMQGIDLEGASRLPGMSPRIYLLTQTTAWWHYVGNWFAPLGLVADDTTFPWRRRASDPVVLLAVGGWVLVAALLIAAWRRRPHLAFLGASALALLSPTSSIVPLSEMVNEHRPYLPLALLSLVWLLPLAELVRRLARDGSGPALGAGAGLALVAAAFAGLTHARNPVFETSESFWKDVVDKAPSARAFNNYGKAFMDRGDWEAAFPWFERAVELSPRWHVALINLGLTHDNLGRPEQGAPLFDRAVASDRGKDGTPITGQALTFRGERHLRAGRWAEAYADLLAADAVSLERFRTAQGLATAAAGLGDANECYRWTLRCLELDRERAEQALVRIGTPFFLAPEVHQAGIEYYQLLRREFPETWWVWHNISVLARKLGNEELAGQAWELYRRYDDRER